MPSVPLPINNDWPLILALVVCVCSCPSSVSLSEEERDSVDRWEGRANRVQFGIIWCSSGSVSSTLVEASPDKSWQSQRLSGTSGRVWSTVSLVGAGYKKDKGREHIHVKRSGYTWNVPYSGYFSGVLYFVKSRKEAAKVIFVTGLPDLTSGAARPTHTTTPAHEL